VSVCQRTFEVKVTAPILLEIIIGIVHIFQYRDLSKYQYFWQH